MLLACCGLRLKKPSLLTTTVTQRCKTLTSTNISIFSSSFILHIKQNRPSRCERQRKATKVTIFCVAYSRWSAIFYDKTEAKMESLFPLSHCNYSIMWTQWKLPSQLHFGGMEVISTFVQQWMLPSSRGIPVPSEIRIWWLELVKRTAVSNNMPIFVSCVK